MLRRKPPSFEEEFYGRSDHHFFLCGNSEFFRIDPPFIYFFALAFLGGVLLECFLLRREKPWWVLPAVLLALEVGCEWFCQFSPGWDALLFFLVGLGSLFAIAGALLGMLICFVWMKLCRS